MILSQNLSCSQTCGYFPIKNPKALNTFSFNCNLHVSASLSHDGLIQNRKLRSDVKSNFGINLSLQKTKLFFDCGESCTVYSTYKNPYLKPVMCKIQKIYPIKKHTYSMDEFTRNKLILLCDTSRVNCTPYTLILLR